MKAPNTSFASRNFIAFTLWLVSFMIVTASSISVSTSATASRGSSARADASSAGSGEVTKPTLPSTPNPFFANTTVTGTKTHTPSGNRMPGDTLTYTVVITNTGGADATGVNFTDTIEPNTTLVANSLKVSPIAVNDTYQTIGNVNISVPAANGLLANDLNPGAMGTLAFTLINATPFVTGTAVATTHGSVIVNTDGSFTYNPTAGYAGPTDSFTYTLGNGTGLTDNATVTININGLIWFVDNSPGANGDGRLSSPFRTFVGGANSLTGTVANDAIFIYTGSGNYAGGKTLTNGEKLIGQGAGASILTITGFSTPSGTNLLPNTGGTNPTIAAAVDNITLGTGNTVRGVTLNVTAVGATALTGSSFGTLTLAETTIGGTNGRALSLSTGTLTGPVSSTAAFTGISSTNSSLTGITLTTVAGAMSSGSTTITNSSNIGLSVNTSSAAFNFVATSATGSGGTGVSLLTNTGTITFSSLTITPDANQRGLLATDNTATITATNGAISNNGAVAIEITRGSGTTPLPISLTSVSANGGSNGIILTNTSGSFTVTGDGGSVNNGSGGTITTPTGDGILINTSSNVSLSYMTITNPGATGIRTAPAGWVAGGTNGTNGVNGFTLNRCNISDNAGNVAADDDLTLANASGTVSITNCVFTAARHQGITIDNYNTNMSSLTLQSSTVTLTPGGDGILMKMRGSSVMTTGTIGGATPILADMITCNSSTCFQISNEDSGNIQSITIQNNTFTGNNAGTDLDVSNGSSLTATVQNNTFTNQHATVINMVQSTGATAGSTSTVSVKNNTIGIQGTKDSGSAIGSGIRLANGAVTISLTIDSNIIREVPNGRGITVENSAYAVNGNVKVKITNNTIARPSGTNQNIGCGANTPCPLASVFVLSDSNGLGGFDHVCTTISGNSAYDPTSFASGGEAAFYFARRTSSSNTLQLEGTQANAKTQILATNTVTNFTSADVIDEGTSGNVAIVSAGTCGTFPAMAPPEIQIESAVGQTHPDSAASDADTTRDVLRATQAKSDERETQKLTPPELVWMVQQAIQRWRQVGISADDIARLEAVTFELADLPGALIAEADGTQIKIDQTAAGFEWYFDQSPIEDSEFEVPVIGRELQTTEYSPAHGKIDLLTVVMRELGEVYLQAGKRIPKTVRKKLQPLMETTLSPSVRRLPDPSAIQIQQPDTSSFTTQSQDAPAQDLLQQSTGSSGRRAGRVGIAGNLAPQSGETVTQALGTIPVNEKVTLTFQVTIDNPMPPNVCTVTNPAAGSGANVTGGNFPNVTIAADSATIVKPPTIGTCPSNITKNADPNVCTAVTTFTTPTSDACRRSL